MSTAKKLLEKHKEVNEGRFERMASTDEQEDAVRNIVKWAEQAGSPIVGGTTIGKRPQSVVLDLTRDGSEIHITPEGDIEMGKAKIKSLSDFKKQVQ